MCLGIPGQVVRVVDAERALALVDIGGVHREVDFSCLISEEKPIERCVGDWVVVHVGFAMSQIDEREADKTLKLLEDLGQAQEEWEAMRASSEAG